MDDFRDSPIITVGRYAGTPIDKLPNSYLRWMLSQKDFPSLWLECARRKLEQSDYYDANISVSRHAIDMFSKRFIHLWNYHIREKGDQSDGIATFLVKFSQEAWDKGADISKKRHQDDGIVKEYQGIRFVFGVIPNIPDYHNVVTVMKSEDPLESYPQLSP